MTRSRSVGSPVPFARMRAGLPNDVRPTLNFNLPGSDPSTTTWTACTLEEYIICNIAVVDTDIVNGAIDLLPSTNREFYPFWRYALKRKIPPDDTGPDEPGRRSPPEVDTVASRNAEHKRDATPDDVADLWGEERTGWRSLPDQRRQDDLLSELV